MSITCTIPVECFKIPIIPESVVHTFNLFIKPLYSSLQSSKAIAVDCSSSFYPVNTCYWALNEFFSFFMLSSLLMWHASQKIWWNLFKQSVILLNNKTAYSNFIALSSVLWLGFQSEAICIDLNPLHPKIKIWILICCPYLFPTEVVGRSW